MLYANTCHEQSTQDAFKEPQKGLVGVKRTAQIIIDGKEVDCFLDTGSQVTTFPSHSMSHISLISL